ncbi:DUF2786 domain-containing protein [Thiomicrorhabdus sp. Kp2]|uniref:DUF2786 domain-containing protein n=1 Tax=Thiomicrorhabdus sp. Kp2 TaxID=1123518 RepID=UPI00040E1B70|nr:DUF2786 domain-containing protein [Thiomicrorhabdus sp. Kp2]
MTKQEAIKKILKCIELSKSSNANEAASAMRQAQKLMQKYSVSNAEVELSEFGSVETETHTSLKKPAYQHALVRIVCKAFGVDAMFSYRTVHFIGLSMQVEVASYAYQVLFRQLKKDRLAYLSSLSNRYKKQNKTRKADLFAEGWVYEVHQKLTEFANHPKHDQLLKQYKEANFKTSDSQPNIKRHKSTNKDNDAILKGMEAGKNAELNRGMNGQQQMRLDQ